MPLFGFQNDWCNWVEKAISDLDSGIKVRDIACAYVKCKCTLSNDNALRSKDIITSSFFAYVPFIFISVITLPDLPGKVRLGVCKIFMMRCEATDRNAGR